MKTLKKIVMQLSNTLVKIGNSLDAFIDQVSWLFFGGVNCNPKG